MILMLLPTLLTGIIFFLYDLPPEPILYIAILWFLSGTGACMAGFHHYKNKIHLLTLIASAPDINLSRLAPPADQSEIIQQEIMNHLNQMRMDIENASRKSLEEMTDYYTMWAHQIKTPIFALRLLLQENLDENKEELSELFKIEQYVDMVLGYLRTEDMSSDLKLSRCCLDQIIRKQIHKYAGIFISRKLTLTYSSISQSVLTDEKWLGFVIGQILSNSLKYTRTGDIRIYLMETPEKKTSVTLVIEDTGIGIRSEDLPRIFEKGYTGFNGRDDHRATGIGLYLSNKIMHKLGHRLYAVSQEGVGTKIFLEFPSNNVDMY